MSSSFFQRQLAKFIDMILSILTSFLTGVYPKSPQEMPQNTQGNVYFANHASHGDFLIIWVSLSKQWRMVTRPVAAADYWLKSPIRRFVIDKVFDGFLVDRTAKDGNNIIDAMHHSLQGGKSLIIFPEGTRNVADPSQLKSFKSGIYHLARYDTQREFIPMWISNMNYVLPKGHILPVPLLCRVTIGDAITLAEDESKEAFLQRCQQALLDLAPSNTRSLTRTLGDHHNNNHNNNYKDSP